MSFSSPWHLIWRPRNILDCGICVLRLSTSLRVVLLVIEVVFTSYMYMYTAEFTALSHFINTLVYNVFLPCWWPRQTCDLEMWRGRTIEVAWSRSKLVMLFGYLGLGPCLFNLIFAFQLVKCAVCYCPVLYCVIISFYLIIFLCKYLLHNQV